MVQKQQAYKKMDSFAAISALCHKLPNLLILDFTAMDEDPNSEFSRTYGFEAVCGTCLEFPEQLRLCQIVKPESVLIPLLECICFCHFRANGMHDMSLFTGLQGVEHLDIRLDLLVDRLGSEQEALQCFRSFWAQTTNVKHLAVGWYEERQAFDPVYSAFMAALLDSRWPLLRKLELLNMTVSQPKLHSLLLSHRRTLKCLHLRNITLRNDLDEHTLSIGSVLKSLVFLHTELQLQEFVVQSYVATYDAEFFRTNDDGEKDSQLRNVQEFVCHRATFPFRKAARILGMTDACIGTEPSEPLSSNIAVQASQHDSLTEETRRRLAYRECMSNLYTDSSWRWCDDDEGEDDSELESSSSVKSDLDAAALDWGISDEWSDDIEESSGADDAETTSSASEDDDDDPGQ